MASRKYRRLVVLLGLLVPACAIGAGSLLTNDLVKLAVRHKMPLPPREARLVLVHTGSHIGIGDHSSLYPAIYSPAFLLEDNQERILVLRGTEKESLTRSQFKEPLQLPFSATPVQPKPGGYAVGFGRLSTFMCAVQLAARGDENTAQQIWENLKTETYFPDAEPQEDVTSELENPRLLFGRCMYEHLRNRIMDEPGTWQETYERMRALFHEFPSVFSEPRPKHGPRSWRGTFERVLIFFREFPAQKKEPPRKQVLV